MDYLSKAQEKSFRLTVLTPEMPIYEGDVVSVIAPGEIGYLGILANHAPLITNIIPGKLIYRDKAGVTSVMSLGAGFLEVLKNQVIVLVSFANL